MTHKEIVEEWKEKFRKELKLAYKGILSDEVLENSNPWFEQFIEDLALASAKGAAEAGKLCKENDNCDCGNWTAADYQSQRQIAAYFEE